MGTAKTQRTGNSDQIPRRGAVDGTLVRPLGRRAPNLATKGLKTPFAANFGMDLEYWQCFRVQCATKCQLRESKWVQKRSKGVKMAQNGSKQAKMAQSGVKIAQNRAKMPQNRPKKGLRGKNKHCQNTADRKRRPNTPQGQWMPYLCGLWAAGYQIWPQRGLKAPFAAKFGMDLGVLAVFLGPVCHPMPAA